MGGRPAARIGLVLAVLLTIAVAAVVALLLGIVGLLASNVRIRDEQARTEVARQRAMQNLALAMDALNLIYLRVAEERFLRHSRAYAPSRVQTGGRSFRPAAT